MLNFETSQMCTRCVMDTSAAAIRFDESGRCNFCRDFEAAAHFSAVSELGDAETRESLAALVSEVKKEGARKPYDCIVGVSGGLDSSWTLVKAKELGLRPLAVHMDNGWNSELATNNIYNLVDRLDVDLYTYVVNWSEYRNLMLAFFNADVIDVELLYDNAMLAVCYEQARKYGIRFILSGSNAATEGLAIPEEWNWRDKRDARNIRSIARSSNVKVKSLPTISNLQLMIDRYVRRIEWVPFLDFFDYRKDEALTNLTKEYGYKPYPYKHYENVFTRFYQAHILPVKFGVDKRKVHLSSLIMSDQITRKEALALLKQHPYPQPEDLAADLEYFLKKMEWDEIQLDEYLKRNERPHTDWGTDLTVKYLIPAVRPFTAFFRKAFRVTPAENPQS